MRLARDRIQRVDKDGSKRRLPLFCPLHLALPLSYRQSLAFTTLQVINMYTGQASRSSLRTGYYQSLSPPPTPRLMPIPLPPAPYEGPTPHPLLTYAVRPKIAYNLLTSSLLAHPPYTESGWTYKAATSPPTPFMKLRCTMLPGDISVFSSHSQHVTIRDVLSAVSDAYQRAVPAHARDKEKRLVPSSLCNGSTVLSTSFMWAGISDQIEPDVWLLHIEELYWSKDPAPTSL